MHRRLPVAIIVAGAVLLFGGIAFAALTVRSAEVEASAATADPDLYFRYRVPGAGVVDYYATYDPVPSAVTAGPGETHAELVDGRLEITLSDAWSNTVAMYGDDPTCPLEAYFDAPPEVQIVVSELAHIPTTKAVSKSALW